MRGEGWGRGGAHPKSSDCVAVWGVGAHGADTMPKASSPTLAESLKAKHAEFEVAASGMHGAERSVETTPRGVEQHVVRTERAVLRWPVSYERGASPE